MKRRVETLLTLSSSLGLLAISLGAFTRRTRYEILERDNFTCQECGISGNNVRFEASHKFHRRGNGYDSPKNGVTHCRCCHYKFHLQHRGKAHLIGLSEDNNEFAIQSIYERLTKEELARMQPKQLEMFVTR